MPEYVIETPEGYHVIMLIGRRSSIRMPLSAVYSQIEQRIRKDVQTKARQSFLDNQRAKAEIYIDRKALSEMFIQMSNEMDSRQHFQPENKTPAMPGR
jgi:hypothetical protein